MEKLFLQILEMSVTAGYCILVVLVLRLLIKRLPKLYSYILWIVVYFRLVCPVSVNSVFSLVRVQSQVIPEKLGVQPHANISNGTEQAGHVVETVADTAVPLPADARMAESVNMAQAMISVAVFIWIAVALLLILYNIASLMRLKTGLNRAILMDEDNKYRIFESESLGTPFVLGFFEPRIYLPAGLSENEKNYVLAHEKTHVRRKDYLVKQLAFLVTCIYWFHPLVWLAFYLMCQDMEMACDESVIRSFDGETKKDYSMTLLSLAQEQHGLKGSPLAFGEGGIKKRIMNVLHYRKPTFWVSVIVVMLLVAVLIGLVLDPKEDNHRAEATDPTAISEEQAQAKDQMQEDLLAADRRQEVEEQQRIAEEQERLAAEREQQNNGVPLTVFYANDTAEFLLSKTVAVSEINAGEIIGQLQEAQVLGGDTILLRMEIGSDGCMILDFNNAFGQQLGMYGSSGEYLMVGSTVNTFLEAFPECDRAQIFIEGEPCSYGQMDYSKPFAQFTNVETTILASIKIEGQEQEIEMSRIAAAPGFAINYDKDRFEQKEEVSGMTSFIVKAGGLSAQLDCWKNGGTQSDTVSELKKWNFGTNVNEERVVLEQQGYEAVKLSEKETGADVTTEFYVIADGPVSWVLRLIYSPEAEEGLLPELIYTLNSFQILH
ncbi:MAG: M56 family metallopeptidase [bacterium]|nr:M56 family metallopeptidase [bacterium]MDY4098625.1 M56 family metallopeptidase [Lachnospiraceae bacterium]